MKRLLLLAVTVLIGACAPEDLTEVDFIEVPFSGLVLDGAQTNETGTIGGIGGIRVALLQLDSLRNAGLDPTIQTDTSATDGSFYAKVRLNNPRSTCRTSSVPLIITFSFTDPRNRYLPKVQQENFCRYTIEALNAAASMRVLMARPTP